MQEKPGTETNYIKQNIIFCTGEKKPVETTFKLDVLIDWLRRLPFHRFFLAFSLIMFKKIHEFICVADLSTSIFVCKIT